MAGKNRSYWHCQRLRPPLHRSPFWIPDLPVASSLFAFPSPNARLHAPSTKATGDESASVLSYSYVAHKHIHIIIITTSASHGLLATQSDVLYWENLLRQISVYKCEQLDIIKLLYKNNTLV